MKTNELKWWQMRRVKMTRQYVAGLIGGTGFGITVGSMPSDYRPLGMALGSFLVFIGSTMAYHDQHKSEPVAQEIP